MDACIHISNKNVLLDREFEPGTPASLVRCSTTELYRPINIYGPSRPSYHISPLIKLLRFKKLTTNTFTLSGLIDSTNACIVTAPNVTEKREI